MKPIRPTEVEFTKSGWRQFAGLHSCIGEGFVLGVMLRYEVAAYIAAHEEQGIALDATCQEIHYDSGLYMLLMKCQGVWYITEVWMTSAPGRFVPVFFWQCIRRGLCDWPAKVLIGWRALAGVYPPESEVIA